MCGWVAVDRVGEGGLVWVMELAVDIDIALPNSRRSCHMGLLVSIVHLTVTSLPALNNSLSGSFSLT